MIFVWSYLRGKRASYWCVVKRYPINESRTLWSMFWDLGNLSFFRLFYISSSYLSLFRVRGPSVLVACSAEIRKKFFDRKRTRHCQSNQEINGNVWQALVLENPWLHGFCLIWHDRKQPLIRYRFSISLDNSTTPHTRLIAVEQHCSKIDCVTCPV